MDTTRYPRSASGYLRIQQPDGSYRVSNAINIPVIAYNPAIFYDPTLKPNPGVPFHSSSYASATISVDGSIEANDIGTITIRDRVYTYTVQQTDTTTTIRDAFVRMIHDYDPEVDATASALYARIRLKARIPGPIGNGIPLAVSVTTAAIQVQAQTTTTTSNDDHDDHDAPRSLADPDRVQLVALLRQHRRQPDYSREPGDPRRDDQRLCHGHGRAHQRRGRRRDAERSAVQRQPEQQHHAQRLRVRPGRRQDANILYSGLQTGYVGVYRVDMELNTSLPTDPNTTLTLSQLTRCRTSSSFR